MMGKKGVLVKRTVLAGILAENLIPCSILFVLIRPVFEQMFESHSRCCLREVFTHGSTVDATTGRVNHVPGCQTVVEAARAATLQSRTMNEPDNFALVPKPRRALEKPKPGAKRILSGMVADIRALARVGLDALVLEGKRVRCREGMTPEDIRKPGLLSDLAAERKKLLEKEAADLEEQADQLAAEIKE